MPEKDKTVKETAVQYTSIILPQETNSHGNVFGGTLMSIIDKAAAVVAQRHCRRKVVTASIDRVDFLNALKVGHIVDLTAALAYVGRTSMVVVVEVHGENPLTGDRKHVCQATTTFVALDDDDRPTTVPELLLETDDERQRFDDIKAELDARRAKRRHTIL